MSKNKTQQAEVKAAPTPVAAERKKRSITEIRESKQTGEKMVYMSVPDYTSAKWAELAGVDVAVVGDSLAMVAHGHPSQNSGDQRVTAGNRPQHKIGNVKGAVLRACAVRRAAAYPGGAE